MTDEDKIENLRNKIFSYLDNKEILSTEETISFYDLAEACRIEFGCYTNFFKKDITKHAKKINAISTLNNILGYKLPYIDRVIPSVKDYNSVISIYLSNYSGVYCGRMDIIDGTDTPILIDFNENSFSDKRIIEFISKCYNEFVPMLITLRIFKKEFGMDYTWDLSKPDINSIFTINDGFMEGKINLNDPDSSRMALTNRDDIILATNKNTRYGELYDYIDFYNDRIQKKFPVNVKNLNPLYKSIIDNHYVINNSNKLMR